MYRRGPRCPFVSLWPVLSLLVTRFCPLRAPEKGVEALRLEPRLVVYPTNMALWSGYCLVRDKFCGYWATVDAAWDLLAWGAWGVRGHVAARGAPIVATSHALHRIPVKPLEPNPRCLARFPDR